MKYTGNLHDPYNFSINQKYFKAKFYLKTYMCEMGDRSQNLLLKARYVMW